MLTVLMATYNGAQTLPRVLESYLRLISPDGGWRLVIVNNNSDDDTLSVLDGFVAQLPMTVINCDRRGKNVALNKGLNFVDGDLLVLTDDDAVPEDDWLVRFRQTADACKDFDIFGGRIVPIWPDKLPTWIPKLVNLGATYAITPSSLRTGPVSASQIWGPNMAIRTKVFSSNHRFNEDVGPTVGQYVMGSEVDFVCRMERLGHRAWFITEAQVGHIVRAHQVDRIWIIRRAYRLGMHMFHQESVSIPSDAKLFRGAPRWKYREYLSAYFKVFCSKFSVRFEKKFLAEWNLSFIRGYLAEADKSNKVHSVGKSANG